MSKFIFIFALLFSTLTFADNDYTDNPDGSSSYIGNCALHPDYIGKGLEVGKTLLPYYSTDYRMTAADADIKFASFSPLIQIIVKQGFEFLSGAQPISNQDLFRFFDDISVMEISFKYYNAPADKLYMLNYGVGGGNGGYMYFAAKMNNEYEIVGATFDGEIRECKPAYIFK